MSKVRVYEVAKQLGVDEAAALALLQQQGAPVRNRLSAVEQDVVERARKAMERAKSPTVVEERIRPTVVRRKATPKPASADTSGELAAVSATTAAAIVPPTVIAAPEPMPQPKVASSARMPVARPVREDAPRAAREEAPVVEVHAPETHHEAKAVVEAPRAHEAPTNGASHVDAAPAHVAVPRVVAAKHHEVVAPPPAPEASHAAPAHVASHPVAAVAEAPEPPAAASASSPDAPAAQVATRSQAPKTGIETWAGRPGVPMPQPVQSRAGAMRPGMGGVGVAPRRSGLQYDPRKDQSPPGRPGMGGGPAMRPGMPGGPRGGGGGRGSVGGAGVRQGRPGFGPTSLRRPGTPEPQTQMAAHKKVIKIDEKVTLNNLASRMSLKATDVLMKLLAMGMTGVNINSSLDADTAKILANEFGWEVSDVAVSDDEALKEARGDIVVVEDTDLETRPPVVTVMGHVDHGKTSLLDYIRKATVASGEAGGITQHIGAYRVITPRGAITFLDTPGHEAFSQMRARGASVTDIVVLVVAADDGVMPQTREAVAHAKAAKVPIVVAVNKIDKPGADPQRPRRELMELELVPEELGGETMFIDVSAKTGEGIDALLDALALQSEVLELKANPNKQGTGTVIEALLDRGKGPVARVLVRDGTLQVGDIVLAGSAYGKIRAMTDEHGRAVAKAGPSTPVEILGLNDVPNAGDPVDIVKDAKKAQELAELRGAKVKRSMMPASAKVSLEDLAQRVATSGQLELRLLVKADVQGSVEAVADALQKLTAEKVRVTMVHSAVGAITEGDVNLAAASKAIIIGFNVRPAGKAAALADAEGVEIRPYTIIYQAVDEVKKAMAGLLPPTIIEKFLGRAEVRLVFNISKVGVVAGSMVVDGTIKRSASKARLLREGATVWEGKISGLKHLKEDRKEVDKGFECGISLDGYSDVKAGDMIEAFDIEEVAATL